MKAEQACIPCIMRQAYNTATRATNDKNVIQEILNRTADYIKTLDYSGSPADASNYVYEITKEITGIRDPYEADKRKYNDICLSMVEKMRGIIHGSEDPLKTAVKIAIYGNLIDLGIGLKFDLEKDLDKVLQQQFPADDYSMLRALLDSGRKKILYLGDNAGEIVFDRLLIEILSQKHDVTFVVKSGPIINDSTMKDAEYVGMTKIVPVIETGSDGIGVKWSGISKEFREHYENADLIISKGQGNFETMNGKKGDIFFMLRAKCDSVAKELGVTFGDIVIRRKKITDEGIGGNNDTH